MRSTVFRFNIVLRVNERESYISDSKMNNISFDFRTFLIKDISKDYSLTSQFRINNDDVVEFYNIDDYCGDRCKYRYYIDGMYGYCGLVYIENSNIELVKRQVLLRKSLYDNILVASEFHFGRFISTWPRYLIRGNKRVGIISVSTKELVVAREDLDRPYPTYVEGDNFSFIVYGQDDTDGIVCDGGVGSKNIGKISLFYKIIENTVRKEVNLFCEKVFELGDVVYEGRFILEDLRVSFDDEILLPIMSLHAENSTVSYDKNNHKYGIITLNTSFRNFVNGVYSGRNRIQIDKGVQ